MGFPAHITDLMRSLYSNKTASVRTNCGNSDWFGIGQGVRQGCILSPYLFNTYAEDIMRTAIDNPDECGIRVGGESISNLRYADDTTLFTTTQIKAQKLLDDVKKVSEEAGLFLNVKKTKLMVIGENHNLTITAGKDLVETVDNFNFLGSMICKKGGCSQEIKRRMGMGRTSMIKLDKIWKSHKITLTRKLKLFNSLIF